jgi:indolepyruvate decarboxylase
MPTVAEYIATRLKQLGAEHLFCIPGNYAAEFLLAAQKIGIECVGTTNELEAGYAADAYSRYRGIGVCSVTYGVGSQSAYDAIAGAFVEFCPVVLVNGSPPLEKIENLRNRNILFAHAIDPLRTDRTIFHPVTVATAEITSAGNAPAEIDRVLQTCITLNRPVYLEVHQGIWSTDCDPPGPPIKPILPGKEEDDEQKEATDAVVTEVLARIKAANHPVIWGGEMLQRLGLAEPFAALVKKSKLPYTTTLMAKGLLPETDFSEQFIGVYDSKFTRQDIKTVVEQSDCLLALGTILSDFYADIAINSADRMILAAGDAVRVAGSLFPNVPLKYFLPKLVERWRRKDLTTPTTETLPGLAELVAVREAEPVAAAAGADDLPLTWTSFFDRMKTFVTDKMVVLTDTGLALFPSAELPITRPSGFLAQTAWLSIGYTCGATLGIALGVPEARAITLVGDGGFQMIPQSFSTLVRQKKPAVVFVMDNGLYGIEQFLIDEQILKKGERFYRDQLPEPSPFDVLPPWDYVKLGEAFGGKGFVVSTLAQLEAALKDVLKLKNVPALVAVKFEPHNLPRGIESVIQTPRPDELGEAEAAGVAAAPAPNDRTEIALGAFN